MDCPVSPELTFDDWGEQLLAPLHGRRYPLVGSLELTERCNLACLHCFIKQPAGSRAARARELTTAQVRGVLDQVADAGCLFLLLTGGEPLLRPDFAEIYRHVRQRGIIPTLFTNGTLLTPRLADVLADAPPRLLEITLYGATRETYERVTQVPGSYARCRRGIELALDRRLPLYLKAVLLTTNRHELAQMSALAEELGVEFRYDGTMWPRLDGGRQPFAYRLSPEEMLALDLEDPERQRAWEEVARGENGRFARAGRVYNCGAGFRSFHINSAGRLSMCLMARRPAYDLLTMTFQEGWARLGALRKLNRQLHTPCETCTAGNLCGQCVGWSQAVHGDNETPVDYVCELGRLRAAQFQAVHPDIQRREN
jgi:radical SAM protein with 4Fe4S-binding SPASM domain